MKVLIGQIRHETNTFANVPTTMESFKRNGWAEGNEVIPKYRGVRQAIGGMIDRALERDIEVVPTIVAYATPSGLIDRETFEQLIDMLLHRIEQENSFDAICLALHGAGVAEGIEDIEGEILERIRGIVDVEIPIVVTLDLHANMTERIVHHSHAIFGDNFYPHIDSYERGVEAVDMVVRIINKEVKPVMHLVKLPLMIPTTATQFSPVKEVNEACHKWESVSGILDCTLFHGFPYSDIAEPGVSVLVTADNNHDLANRAAKEVAKMIWQEKEGFSRSLPTPQEGIRMALNSVSQPVVINETSDNPGAGTPGDGTYLLGAMLDHQLESACFAPMYDPEVADLAHRSGAGTYIDAHLGGKTDRLHGEPLPIRAYVKSLTDGRFVQSSPMGKGFSVNLGKSARLQVGGIDIIVCSARSQLMDEQLLLLHGIDMKQYKIVALKSSHHFRAGFESLCDEIISVDSPGLSTMSFESFAFRNVKEMVYPLHQIDDFEPKDMLP